MRTVQGPTQRLSVHISEKDQYEGQALFEVILTAARKADLAGVTVLRGLYSYGRDKVLHSMGILRISEDLPLLIQIIDSKPNIEQFLPKLQEVAPDALMLLEDVTIVNPR